MRVTLTIEEVREVLVKALGEKTQYALGEFHPEDCYFSVTSLTKDGNEVEVEDLVGITFTGEK
jgi:hypothetical protein